jgi:hypothetical protein
MSNLICDSHKIYLSPSGALTKVNGSMNSSMIFDITNPVTQNPNIVYGTIRITHAEIPYAFYIINNNNNLLSLSTGNITIPVGNYNANTLITQLSSQFPSGMTMTFNTTNGLFTISYSSPFSINVSSTCGLLFGFTSGIVYNSTSNAIQMPYPCNLLGTKNLYIKFTNYLFDNLNPATKDKVTLANIPVNVPCYNLIMYNNMSTIGTIIKNLTYPYQIYLEIRDDDGNLVDFNNIDFNITVEIDYFMDISEAAN